jgi:hypothetical protein
MTLRKVLRRLNSTFDIADHSITLANTAELLRRYHLEHNERSRDSRPRDFVGQVRHVLDGGLTDDQYRRLRTVKATLVTVLTSAMNAENEWLTTRSEQYAFYLVGC